MKHTVKGSKVSKYPARHLILLHSMYVCQSCFWNAIIQYVHVHVTVGIPPLPRARCVMHMLATLTRAITVGIPPLHHCMYVMHVGDS